MVVQTLFPDLTKPFENYMEYLDDVSSERRNKIFRLHSINSRIMSLMTAVFVRQCISKATGIPPKALRFYHSEFGKPGLLDIDNFYFNVSHSEGCIAFVHSNKPVGIDTERVKGYDIRLPRRFFTEHERFMLDDAEDKNLEFCKIWTAKEAYVKMKGSTLANMIRHIDIYALRDADIHSMQERGYLITACEQQ
jgi:4'-phosphopantetheinyl transferase